MKYQDSHVYCTRRVPEEAVQYEESVCGTRSVRLAVRGEGLQYEEIKAAQYEETM